MNKMDLRTSVQIANDERKNKIGSRYMELKSANPKIAPSRIFQHIASELSMTVQAVRNNCIRAGVYVPKEKENDNERA